MNDVCYTGRTFPSHPYFSTQLGPGQLSLFNLLKAYSLLDEEVGYCQGLSFIAGILLMHVSSPHSVILHCVVNNITALVLFFGTTLVQFLDITRTYIMHTYI